MLDTPLLPVIKCTTSLFIHLAPQRPRARRADITLSNIIEKVRTRPAPSSYADTSRLCFHWYDGDDYFP